MRSFEPIPSFTLNTLLLSRYRGPLSPTSNLMNLDCWKPQGDLPKLSPWVCWEQLK